jgi:SsrA-binding protein
MPAKKKNTQNITITNRKAGYNYFILEKIETGIELMGHEVKAVRNGNVDLSAGFATIRNEQVLLNNVHIKPYEYTHHISYEPRRARRLLLHKKQIIKLIGKISQKGITLIPLSLYFTKKGKIKVLLGVCKGKHTYDKRETLKRKTTDFETKKAVSKFKH